MNKDFLKLNELLSQKHLKAKNFAKDAHDSINQKRKDGRPYWVHPLGVSDILEACGANEDICCAACLHDIAEDIASISIKDIEELFGDKVAELVSEVTTDKEEKELLGKELTIDREMSFISDDALSIKLADQVYNYSDKADLKQKRRIQHHIEFVKNNRQLNKLQKQLIGMLEEMFEYI